MCLPQKNQKVKNVETSQLEFWWDILLLLAIAAEGVLRSAWQAYYVMI